ncbi:RAS guanyl-releasing protein 4 isoform X3 [Hippoglossus stenolepis]|uniref:RAS guanyl-releasing protein 4 isoform X3 n=1 Tax=Hippoglossus stenolepis TaxID=195615 RepID=UPI00159C2871|nr:RAS guanyl-releasing protein 4 isoform X3 [Hippoglossus stenolepis]
MNKTKRKSSDSPAVLKSRKLVQRRRNTCPSPQDISRALQSPSSPSSSSAASLDELIQRCLNCFDSEGKLSSPRGSQLVHVTLMMHSWVVPSQTFAQKLLALYKDGALDKRGQRRAQICHLVRQWISQFPAVFEADPMLEQTMGDLWALVRSDGEETQSQLIDSSCLGPHANASQAPSPSVKKRKVSLIFDHMEPEEMAQHISYLEFKNFCNVSKLRSLQNFNTLMAVTGGLCHSSISRLKDTSNLLPPDVTKALSEMTELLASRSNYSNYRRLYNECSGFKVPILGVHLKDLISLNEALPDYIDGDKINLSKLQHLYSNINDLLAIHSCTPPFEANKDLLHLLTLSLDLYYTEDEIYELSYTKEPRNPKIQPVAPVKPPVVAEWGSGVNPRLDPDTISKHVKQMVDSIMKNYNQNQDGYISQEDFEKIAANFPFSFCTHETEREGQISREEITSYFMRGMSICAKLGYNFRDVHNFHETTYKRPTFCDTCGGFLWGVIKQGYHCKDCGINCHRHCRNLVGMECLKKHKNTTGSCPCTPAPDSRTKGNSWSSEEETFVFPQSNETEQDKGSSVWKNNSSDSSLSDRSTQTDPGVWTPQKKDKRGNNHNTLVNGSPDKRANTLPPRSRGGSMPVSFLQEKMEELHLYKDKSREPD